METKSENVLGVLTYNKLEGNIGKVSVDNLRATDVAQAVESIVSCIVGDSDDPDVATVKAGMLLLAAWSGIHNGFQNMAESKGITMPDLNPVENVFRDLLGEVGQP